MKRRQSLPPPLLMIGAMVVLAASCVTAVKEPALTPQQRELFVRSFDDVWTTVRDKHWDPEMGGLDWEGVRDELRPKVEAATSPREARGAMTEMLARLGLSHFQIIPSEVYEELDTSEGEGPRDGVTGVDVRVIDGQAVVTSVEEGTPAAAAGVRTGWVIAKIGDDDIPSRLERVAKEFEGDSSRDAILSLVVLGRLMGPVGETLAVGFLDGENREVDLDLTLAEAKGRKVQFGHLPPVRVRIDVDTVAESVGYISFNMFMDPIRLMPEFNKAIKSFMDADGIIIDIRGNPGGLPDMGMGMAGWLVGEEDRYLGTMHTRDLALKLVVNPRAETFGGPVAVLVDGLSGSASEIFAGGLQDLGRAAIVGSRTAGAALPSAIVRLPNGDGFQYAFANYVSAGGEVLEGKGVAPDIEAPPTREALLQGRDPALDAAIEWIRSQRK